MIRMSCPACLAGLAARLGIEKALKHPLEPFHGGHPGLAIGFGEAPPLNRRQA